MIIFEKVKFKNFLSFGNRPVEIKLDQYQNTCIIGKNAAGKSVFMDAITYALFNKAYRPINKPQLVNSVNDKNCIVEIEFTIGKTNWKIIRGQKPNIFEIYKNGEMLDQNHSVIEQQRWLEQNILKMNYKSFTQIVILGNSNFTPFMQLTPASRREVIEELLDIKIFSSMNVVIKDKLKEIKDNIKLLEVKRTSILEKVDLQKNFIKGIENEGNIIIDNKKLKINELQNEIKNSQDTIEKVKEDCNNLSKEIKLYSTSSGNLKKLRTSKGKLENKIDTIKLQIKFFKEQITCPTCTQTIENQLKQNKIGEFELELKQLQLEYSLVNDNIKSEEQKEEKYDNISSVLNHNQKMIALGESKISQLNKQINDLEKDIKTTKYKIENQNTEQKKLDSFISEYDQIDKEYMMNKGKIKYYEYVHDLLKDTGVKSRIIKKYLPLINKQVNKYLRMMDFYINFNLNENFDEVINTPLCSDFSYSSFSEGQKQRINLALLFAWREIARIKNSTNVNLLILDEVFDSSLDSTGTEDFLKIIKHQIKDSNTFVISHKENIQDRFDTVIEFRKKGNFSELNVLS
jgi:DNA repair exonuclease SbcCD ATPase subunit